MAGDSPMPLMWPLQPLSNGNHRLTDKQGHDESVNILFHRCPERFPYPSVLQVVPYRVTVPATDSHLQSFCRWLNRYKVLVSHIIGMHQHDILARLRHFITFTRSPTRLGPRMPSGWTLRTMFSNFQFTRSSEE